ncbi:MAG: protoheme IX farnesyltransferase [Elusimicrobia bacterium]|nr:protoheme IX farnesyltransferase [Elusimicrobiota bacterium]
MGVAAAASAPALPAWRAYAELAKPGITLVVVMTATAGYLAGAGPALEMKALLVCLAGTALASAGAGALNMTMERASDALMNRTRGRPLPSGRLDTLSALAFGVATSVSGVAVLSVLCNPAAGAVSALTLALYVFLYTPLKRVSAWCMVPGAISGALPPLIGYAAATGTIRWPGLTLFSILFLWQFPHIVALAWMYREDYERAGLQMLPGGPHGELKSALLAAGAALLLIPAAVLPMQAGLAGPVYGCGAAVLSSAYAAAGLRFAVRRDRSSARALFFTSISYVPFLLVLLAAGR